MSTKKFLYDELDTLSKWAGISQNIPDSVAQGPNPKYELRPYQVEAFARFFPAKKTNHIIETLVHNLSGVRWSTSRFS